MSLVNKKQEVWTLAEVRDGKIHPVSHELLAWGRTLADARGTLLASLVLGHSITDQANDLIAHGADIVYVVDAPEMEPFYVDSYTRVLKELVEKYQPEILIASATTQGRTVMPTLSAAVNTGLTADCTGLAIEEKTGLLVQTRPAIGGNVMADIKTPEHRPQMCTVRPKSKRPLPVDPSRKGEVIRHTPASNAMASLLERLQFVREKSVGLPIQEAEVIVAGGKGMKGEKNFRLLEELATLLGGSVGASRNAVDLGWAPYSAQVGLSGKAVTPQIYIACGISGAVQHIAGMSGSGAVIAINSDPEAPIFRTADLGIIGDVQEVLPQLIDMIKTKGGAR